MTPERKRRAGSTAQFKMKNGVDWSQCSELESIPGKVSGAWVFRGTRVPVSAVLQNLETLNVDEVAAEFPSVTATQVRAVLDFLARSADPEGVRPQNEIMAVLARLEPRLRAAGIRSLSLFGSVARGDERAESDVDVAVELDPSAHLGLRFFAIQRELSKALGRSVDLVPEPVTNPRLRANMERDRRRVF